MFYGSYYVNFQPYTHIFIVFLSIVTHLLFKSVFKNLLSSMLISLNH